MSPHRLAAAVILLGLGLATRAKKVRTDGDLDALSDIESRIEDELRRLERIDKHSDSIRRNCDGIGDEVRRARNQLELLIRKAKSALAALNIELHEEDVEKRSPILLPARSLDEAVRSVTLAVAADPSRF